MIQLPPRQHIEPKQVYRSALVLEPRQPFIDWHDSLPGCNVEYAQVSLDEGESVFLIPDADELESVEDYIDEHFDVFFTAILDMHAGHADQWPAPRTVRMFRHRSSTTSVPDD